MADIIDVTVDEAKAIQQLQKRIERVFIGKPKDLKIMSEYKRLLEEGMGLLGFKVSCGVESVNGNWNLRCDIVGRTDEHLQHILNTEGADIERKVWDLRRESQDELKRQGVNTDLI